jgi:FMN phosphatase YigB (HAD superfamily)
MNPGRHETRFVVFDIGGILIELGGVQDFGDLIGVDDPDDIWRRWLTSPWVRRYERGQCSREAFAEGLISENQIGLEPSEFLRRFGDWPKGLLPGAEELVTGLADGITSACLSNTNEMHWNEQPGFDVLHELFELQFLSHELGLIKPDREIYDHVVMALDCRPEEILFIDDNQINIDGARTAGLDAHRAVGVEATRALLASRGLHARET